MADPTYYLLALHAILIAGIAVGRHKQKRQLMRDAALALRVPRRQVTGDTVRARVDGLNVELTRVQGAPDNTIDYLDIHVGLATTAQEPSAPGVDPHLADPLPTTVNPWFVLASTATDELMLTHQGPKPPTANRDGNRLRLGHRSSLQRVTPTVLTGDDGFDREFVVQGLPWVVGALLDHPARRLLRDSLLDCDTVVWGGSVLSSIEVTHGRPVEWIRAAVARTVGIAKALQVESEDMPARLATIALSDPVPQVRRRAVELLQRHMGDSDVTRDASEAALVDLEPSVQVQGAVGLGERGRAFLRQVPGDSSLPDAPRIQAIEELANLDGESADELIAAVLEPNQPPAVLRAAAAAAARRCMPRLVDHLAPLAMKVDAETASFFSSVLGAEASALEPALLAALARASDDDAVLLARALGQAGSAAALGPLRARADRSRSVSLSREVGAAKDRILARMSDDEFLDGRLSVAGLGDDGGRLSLPNDADGGALTLTVDRENPSDG